MNFRFKAFALHLLASAVALTLVLGILYSGWYRWPGWYLTGAAHVIALMVGVDVAFGPLLTLVIANPRKPHRELIRDIALIVAVQVIALVYGTATLWHGRPLYYAFSVNELALVQASDLDPRDVARVQRAPLAPRWSSVPRWIWAPLPDDPQESDRIVLAAITGGYDVTAMPRYFKPWNQGLPALRAQLKKVGNLRFFSAVEIDRLKRRMQAAGLAIDQRNAIPLTGRGHPLLAVFDPASMQMQGMFPCT